MGHWAADIARVEGTRQVEIVDELSGPGQQRGILDPQHPAAERAVRRGRAGGLAGRPVGAGRAEPSRTWIGPSRVAGPPGHAGLSGLGRAANSASFA
jgi:hypothetical protein